MSESAASPRWQSITDLDQAGCEVVSIVRWLRDNDSGRLARCVEDLSLYEGCRLPGLSPAAYLRAATYDSDEYKKLRWNIPRSLVHTVQAKLAGKNKPKVQFVTSAASWQQRRRAYHLDRFAEAQMHLRQGQYGNIWELAALVLLHSLDLGDGFAYVYADDIEQQVAVEPIFPWQLFVDPNDAAQGRPQCLFLSRPFDRDKLASEYQGDERALAAIKSAPSISQTKGTGMTQSGDAFFKGGVRSAEQIEVIDAWSLPTGKDDKGKPTGGWHLRCVDGKGLERVPWVRNEFPFARLRWAPQIQGYWSQSLVGEVRPISDEINAIVQRLSDCVRLTQKGVWLIPNDCVKEGDLEGNDDCVNVHYDAVAGKPEFMSPSPFDQATIEWLRMNIEQCYGLPGVSQMSAQARKDPGVDAAIAMRTIQDVETERLGTQQNGYELFFVDIARHMIACTRELAEKNPGYSVRWPGESFLKEIKWKDVDLPEDQYIMRPYPVSGMKNTPTDRLQLAQDMFGAGIFSPTALEQSVLYLNSKDHLSGGGDKQEKLIERYIESWLDATPETLESGEFKFRSPFPYLKLPAAMLQVAEAYVDAQLDDAPDFNLDFFLRWIEQADTTLQERTARQAQAQQAQPPPGSAVPAPPAPPMAA